MSNQISNNSHSDIHINSNHQHTNNEVVSTPIHNLLIDSKHRKTKTDSLISRRRFIQGTTAAVASASLVGCGSDSDSEASKNQPNFGVKEKQVDFLHGIASGDPLADKVILWTRVTPANRNSDTMNTDGSIKVTWQIATDDTMNNIINSGEVSTSAGHDYTVKVDADGLQANTLYYYRFAVGSTHSPIGRTKTLPTGNVQQVKMVVFSCANYPAGYFHVYADAAKRNDIDVAVHLGDYIYEYARYEEDNNNNGEMVKDDNGNPVPAYASANAESLNRQVNPAEELVNITDYRTRYAQYKTDKDLQALHANIPMIAVWDDHEISNDTYVGGAENHQNKDGKWDERKLAAMTAYHEWMPTRNQTINNVYRSFEFGDLLSLHMLDTRVIGRDKQLDYQDYVKAGSDGTVGLDAETFIAELTDTNRQLLGLPQQNWLASQMQASTSTWQILGQQVIMARMSIPSPILLNFNNSALGVDMPTYLGLKSKALRNPDSLTDEEKSILAQPSTPYNLDAWDGYFVARESVLGVAKSLNKNLVVLSGDTHNAWASNLTNMQGDAVGVEFATSSVTSPGFEEYLADVPPALFATVLPTLIEGGTLKYTDTSQRGYIVLTVTPEQCQSEWVFVSDILQPEYTATVGKTLNVAINQHMITE